MHRSPEPPAADRITVRTCRQRLLGVGEGQYDRSVNAQDTDAGQLAGDPEQGGGGVVPAGRQGRAGRAGRTARGERAARPTTHRRRLVAPFEALRLLSDDHVAHIHESALRFLQEHGVRVLLPEARDVFAAAGAVVGGADDDQLVRIPVEVVREACSWAPAQVDITARNPERSITFGGRSLVFAPAGGPPYCSDLERGRRTGTLRDFEDLVRLSQAFDVLHTLSPTVEAQDVPIAVRHLVTTRSMLTLSDKPVFVYARGRRMMADAFEMVRISQGVGPEEFAQRPYTWTNINTNSPRQLDVPMSLGIIDAARAGQMCIMTPFTLAGAMAPVSMAGALLLQHLEVLASVTLAQLTRRGAPVMYGAFTSNVDMRSGSPAFGTPEAWQGALASGQLARHMGLPWRSSGSSTSNVEDAQAGYETMMNTWGAVLGGANLVMHSAGWQEGGLCTSFEKLILDVEMLQMIAEAFQPIDTSTDELAYDAIAAVPPGGHFFGTAHTLARYERAFYDPMVFTRQNFGQWTEGGATTASTRAHGVWKRTLAAYQPPPTDEAVLAELDDFVARRTAEGGALPD